MFRRSTITVVWLWLICFALAPGFLVLVTSLLTQSDGELVRLQLTFSHYARLFEPAYVRIFLRSWAVAGVCTVGCLLIAYPFSYFVARTHPKYKSLLILMVMIPFWTSSLIRSYAIVAIIKTRGILNSLLLWLGVIDTPLQLMYTQMATVIGLIYTLLPLMILPLYTSIEKVDTRLIDAARDLGAKRHQIFFKVLLPLTVPGILSGSLLVFLPAMTIFFIPDLLGGAKTILLGNIIQNQFLAARNWPMGAAISVTLTALVSAVVWLYFRKKGGAEEWR